MAQIVYPNEARSGKHDRSLSPAWWTLPPTDAWRSINNNCDKLFDDDKKVRLKYNERNRRLFGGLSQIGLYAPGYVAPAVTVEGELCYNIIRAIVLSGCAVIGRSRPRVSVLSQGGNYKLKKRGQQLSKFNDGTFYLTDFHVTLQQMLQDAMVHDTAFVLPYRVGKHIIIDRILDDEIAVDKWDGLYGKPGCIYRQRLVPRDKVMTAFGKTNAEKKIISEATIPQDVKDKSTIDSVADVILVREAWHVQSGSDTGDGKHVLALSSGLLRLDEFNSQRHRVVPLRWTNQNRGYHGKCLVDDVVGVQYEINELLLSVQESTAKNVPRIGVEIGSQIVQETFNDVPYSIIQFAKTPPQALVWPSVSQDVIQQIENHIRHAFDLTGMSTLMATSQRPVGVDSARALRELSEVQSERYILQSQAYESTAVEVADICIDLAKEIAAEHGNYSVRAPVSQHFFESIDWKDVDMERDAFMLRPYPTSFLPLTPSARLATVAEMIEKQMLSREEGMALLDYPDLESVTNLITSTVRHVEMLIEQMLEDGKYRPPSPFVNPKYAAKKMSEAVLQAEMDKYPDDRVDLIRRYVAEANAIVTKQEQAMMAQMQAAQMAQGAPPTLSAPGAGGPPEMIPNAGAPM